jgi:hypothetical protein
VKSAFAVRRRRPAGGVSIDVSYETIRFWLNQFCSQHGEARADPSRRTIKVNEDDAILAVLAESGVDAWFAHPAVSEKHVVAALDREPPVYPIACIFDGVAMGPADGHGRVARTPRSELRTEWPNKLWGLLSRTLQGKPSSVLRDRPAGAHFGARVAE